MAKKIVIVHRWDGQSQSDWYPWLKNELQERGFEVIVPSMPNPQEPTIESWVSALKRVVNPDKDTFLIGHSIGCQAILRYVSTLPKGVKIGGVLFVAGWVRLSEAVTGGEDESKIAKPWLDTPLEWEMIRHHIPLTISIFSDNDPYVPKEDAEIFKEKLNSRIIMLNNMGHMTEDDGVKVFPAVLDAFLEMAKD